jgi:hypothetical protein
MAFKGAATWVSMVLFLAWTMAHGDDSYPTELDFKVAYCDGATEASLQSPMSKLTAALHDLLTKRKQHFATYLGVCESPRRPFLGARNGARKG